MGAVAMCGGQRVSTVNERLLKTSFYSDLFVRMWIDCLDSRGQWYEAQIIAMNQEERNFTVHYKGWQTKWDEVIPEYDIPMRIALYNSRTKMLNEITVFSLCVGTYVDVLDSTGKWLEGKIIEVEQELNLVKVNYIGWGEYWAEYLPIFCYRFALHGTKCKIDNKKLDEHFRHFLTETSEEGFKLQEVELDNSLFRAVSHQLYGDEKYFEMIRNSVCDYMTVYSLHFSTMIYIDVSQHADGIRNGTRPVGQAELFAIANLYRVPVQLYTLYSVTLSGLYKPLALRNELLELNPPRRAVILSYHLDGEYNSMVTDNWEPILRSEPGEFESNFKVLASIVNKKGKYSLMREDEAQKEWETFDSKIEDFAENDLFN